MNWQLLARFVLRLIALTAVSWGYLTEDAAAHIYQNVEIVSLLALALSEGWFSLSKWIGRRRAA